MNLICLSLGMNIFQGTIGLISYQIQYVWVQLWAEQMTLSI